MLNQSLPTLAEHLDLDRFDQRIIIDDAGPDPIIAPKFTVVRHETKQGLAATVRDAWSRVWTCDYLAHFEEDFLLTAPVDLDAMIAVLTEDPKLAQLSLKRDAVNADERDAGGFVEMQPDAYRDRAGWLEHQVIFTLNPCLIPRWVLDVTAGDLERPMTDALLAHDPEIRFGIWGDRGDPPAINHIGTQRSPAWRL